MRIKPRSVIKAFLLVIVFLWLFKIGFKYEGMRLEVPATAAEAVVCVYWAFTIRKRIVPKTMRRVLMAAAVLMTVLFALSTLRYEVMRKDSYYDHFFWYLYYIPLILIPLMVYYASLCIGEHPHQNPVGKKIWLGVPAGLLCLYVLTNDLHRTVFGFEGLYIIVNGGVYTHRFGYYLIYVWITVLLFSSFVRYFRECGNMARKKWIWVPVTVLLIYPLYSLLQGFLGSDAPSVFGLFRVQFQEVFCFAILLYVESCIRIGFIPSNSGYEALLPLSAVSLTITDEKGDAFWVSQNQRLLSEEEMEAARDKPYYADENTLVRSEKIPGGRVYWYEDVTSLNQTRRILQKLRDRLLDDNELLTEENKVAEQQIQYITQNRLYDTIAESIAEDSSKTAEILNHLSDDEEEMYRQWVMVTVYGTFIKRRVNLRLISDRKEEIPVKELLLSVKETLDNLELFSVAAHVDMENQETAPGDQILEAFDLFEKIVLHHLEDMTAVMVRASKTGPLTFLAEIGLSRPGVPLSEEIRNAYTGKVFVITEEDSVLYRISFEEKGGAV